MLLQHVTGELHQRKGVEAFILYRIFTVFEVKKKYTQVTHCIYFMLPYTCNDILSKVSGEKRHFIAQPCPAKWLYCRYPNWNSFQKKIVKFWSLRLQEIGWKIFLYGLSLFIMGQASLRPTPNATQSPHLRLIRYSSVEWIEQRERWGWSGWEGGKGLLTEEATVTKDKVKECEFQ